MRWMISVLVVFALLYGLPLEAADDWTIINVPGASYTYPQDINGDNVVGFYMTADSFPYRRGFLYNVTDGQWTLLDMPQAIDTVMTGVFGDRIVGGYQDSAGQTHGLVYEINSSVWSTLDVPSQNTTFLSGIDGDNVVGTYGGGTHAFVFDLKNSDPGDDPEWEWIDIDINITGATRINPRGISGSKVVGDYRDATSRQHGFLFNSLDLSWTVFDDPSAALYSTAPLDIDGETVVGSCVKNGVTIAFVSDNADPERRTWNYIAKPDAGITEAFGIEGDNIVGDFSSSPAQGFIYTVPEPSSLILLFTGSCFVLRRRKR